MAVSSPEKSGFVVVESKTVINQTNNRVCIPRTWISREIRGEKVAFEYPAEDEDNIVKRVKNKEPWDSSWKAYMGQIKYESESYEDAVGYLQKLCGGNNKQIEDNSNQKPCEDVVGYPQTICGGNSKRFEDNSNEKSYEDAVGYLQPIFGENSKQIEDTSYHIEPVTEPKHPLKFRIVKPKLDQKPDKKKKTQKNYHKKQSKDKVHKSKRRYVVSTSSPNSVDTEEGAESYVSCQSNYQTSEGTPKSLESEISESVHSVPQTYLKNNNSYSSKIMLLESFNAENENNNGMLPEDRHLVENMYIKIMKHVQYMETTALEIKKSQLIAMAHMNMLDKLAAKYGIPLPPVTDDVEREKDRKDIPFEEENLQDDDIDTHSDDGKQNEQNENPFDEDNLQDDEMEAQVTEENDNTSEENLLEERYSTEILLEGESDNQILTDDESSEDFLSSLLEEAKNKRYKINKENDIKTLKHPHPGEGLTPIGRKSSFYIKISGLEKAKGTCKNVKEFARQLYRECFTHKALGTCSMTGLNRPALHYEARTVLQNYALKYGQAEGWDRIDPKDLEKNLRRFLCNNRRYYASKGGKKNRKWKPQKAKRSKPIGSRLSRQAQPLPAAKFGVLGYKENFQHAEFRGYL